MRVGKRKIQDGSQFNAYYTKPANTEKTEIPMGTVEDTCHLIAKLIQRWKHQTIRISKILQLSARNRETTAYTLWYYFFTYFQYKEDRKGIEQLRSPRRAFWDKTTGIDCDCFTISILTMLENIGITDACAKVIQRPGDTDYSHIYVVLPKGDNVDWDNPETYYVIDPVVYEFNKEVGDIVKYKIYPMNSASTLNGLGNIDIATLDGLGNAQKQTGNGLCGYPPQAKVIAQKLLSIKNPDLFKSEVQYAVKFENKWRSEGLIGKDQRVFAEMAAAGMNGLNGWASDLWDKTGGKVIEIVKDQVSDAKNHTAVENAAHIANSGNFTLGREGIKQILKANLFGYATIISYVQKTEPAKYKNILNHWYYYGGDEATFTSFVNEGKLKTPRQVSPAVLNKVPAIKGYIEKANKIHYNKLNGLGAFGADDAAVIASVVAALPILYEIYTEIKGNKAVDPQIVDTAPIDPNGGNNNNGGGSDTGLSTGLKVAGIAALGLGVKMLFF